MRSVRVPEKAASDQIERCVGGWCLRRGIHSSELMVRLNDLSAKKEDPKTESCTKRTEIRTEVSAGRLVKLQQKGFPSRFESGAGCLDGLGRCV